MFQGLEGIIPDYISNENWGSKRLTKGTMYQDAPIYTPQGGKIKWRKMSDVHYTWDGNWVDMTIRFNPTNPLIAERMSKYTIMQQTAQKWEVQISLVFVSRDKNVFFNDRDAAMVAAERLLKKWVGELGRELE